MRSGAARWRLLRGTLLLGWLLLAARPGAAQSGGELVVGRVDALPDRGYAWPRVLRDTTLAFAPADSVRPARARRYWLRLAFHNPSPYTESFRLTVQPSLDNTLYYFDESARAWRTRRAGMAVATDSQRLKGQLPLRLPGQATTTVYVRLRLDPRATLPPAICLRVKLEKAAAALRTDYFFGAAWAASLTAVLLLLLANLYAYTRFKDRAAWFYIWMQVGGALYITAFRGYFKVWFPAPIFSQLVLPNGLTYGYTLNNVAMHLSVALLLLGFVQMTRAYLPTQVRLPRLDAALRYGLRGYGAFTAVVGLVNVSGFCLNQYTLLSDNLLVMAVFGLVLATGVVAYRQRLPLAGTYLLGNALPLLCVLAMAGYHVLRGFDNNGNLLLPDLAIITHALFFSAALSIRLQNLQRTLLDQEREADYLALDIQQKELRNREIILKNQHIQTALLELQRRQHAREEDHQQQQATNQDLHAQLEANQRELASTSLYVQQKNALLAALKTQIRELNKQRPDQKKELAGIQSVLRSHVYLDEDWGRFKHHFEQVHPRFFEELQANYPALTPHEQRLASYFHIQLSAKEIAALLNIDPASVRRAKTRLYKKMAAADLAAGRTATAEDPTGE